MKNLYVLLSALFMVMIAVSCTFGQKNEITDKSYPIESFKSVKFEAVANIIYTQSDRVSVTVEGDKEMIDNLRITERNGILNIVHDKKYRVRNKKNLTIYISSQSIEEVNIDGVGNWTMKGKVKTENLKIDFEGVGNLEALELESNNIKVNSKGVGNIVLGGTTNFLDMKSEGVGSINTQKLLAIKAVVKSSGVGSVKFYASESIDLSNNGVGSITYYGNPTLKNMSNSGVGKIKAGK